MDELIGLGGNTSTRKILDAKVIRRQFRDSITRSGLRPAIARSVLSNISKRTETNKEEIQYIPGHGSITADNEVEARFGYNEYRKRLQTEVNLNISRTQAIIKNRADSIRFARARLNSSTVINIRDPGKAIDDNFKKYSKTTRDFNWLRVGGK